MKKALTRILIVSLLMSYSALFLSACSKEEKVEVGNNSISHNTEFVEGDIFAERAMVDDELGEWDFGGKSLRIVGHNDGYDVFVPDDQVNKGDLIKDAKVSRNKTVEDRLNCKIELAYTGGINELSEYVSKTILSGSDEFDLVVNHVLTSGGMVTKNLFLNWYDIPHVDFTKPWWAASTGTELTYDGKCILAISDLNATAIVCTSVIAFNKNLANSYDLGNLYDLVLNGNWTYDVMYDMIKDVYIDSDGSGDASSGDFYGMIHPVHDKINSWLWAFDNPVVKKDEDGVPTISIKTEKINSIINTIYDLCYNTTGVACSDDLQNQTMFLNRQSIFFPIHLSMVTSEGFRNFEDDYGILPYPKWDQYQSDYHTHVYGEHSVMAVPKTVKDLEFVGVCSELLSAESWKTLTPTIYEIALKTRYLRDSESKEVLDIVLENRYFDFGFVYDNWKGFAYTIYTMMKSKNNNFESFYGSKYNSARVQLKKVIQAFDKLG